MRTMSAPSTYRSKGRSWVKLWVGEWLDGSTRYEMTGAQRAFWIDLLTLAGRSRVPGVICANNENNGFFGYPVSRYEGILGDPSVNVLATLKLFEAQGKIELILTRKDEPSLYAVKVLSWERYQSEYMRQRKTRKGAPKVTTIVTTKDTERCAIEGEVEGDGEEEVEGETSGAFLSFWNEYPRQEKKIRAKFAWFKNGLEARSAEVMASLTDWKRCEQWSDQKFIPYAVNWIEEGLWKQNPYVAKKKESLHEQLNKLGAKP